MILIISLLAIVFIAIYLFMQQPQFGKAPSGERLERVKASPNYKDGAFHNEKKTPMMSSKTNFGAALWERLFGVNKRLNPIDSLPAIKTDIHGLDLNEDLLIWFGHSSYFIQINGKRILIDPVFSQAAAPVSFFANPFKGTSIYTADDIPQIDYLFITHDHYDHLDYKTVCQLKSKVKKVICPLGVGEHLEYWGYDTNQLIEQDWYDKVSLDKEFTVHFTPTRHFSGRTLKRNNTLWTSYVIQTPSLQLFIGGDGGYGPHFAEIGKSFGMFDLALLENGQYDPKWPYIHTQPEQVLQAANDLQAKRILPGHSSKFALANHAWDEPLKRLTQLNNDNKDISILTPLIGEIVYLNDTTQTFTHWWEGVK